ncbi:MAG: flagellar export chaperone FliS [Lachnospiraceae bacterium]|nr:flagellar export chaperone FliS [Lachnospiraceae bacterium]
MKDELKQQYALRITQANKTELVVILYEMFLTYIDDAKSDLKEQDNKTFRCNIQRARGCLKELMGSLNYDYEVASNLLKLYIYVSKLLVTADLHKDEKALDEACKIMQKLHDAYETISKEDHSAPVMGNTQTVYAGLTYSKNDLTVNLDEGGGSRGFFV